MNQNQNHQKFMKLTCAALAFVLAVWSMSRHNLDAFGGYYLQSDDGDLYLSIARNFLQNGHFIQTARPIEAFVVPPGLPAVCTVLLAVGRGSLGFLVGFQYCVYGAAAAFMALAALELALRERRPTPAELAGKSPVPADGARSMAFRWTLAASIGAGVPIAYVQACLHIRHPNPGFILTENYVVFLLALALWMLAAGKDLRALCVELLALTFFRPACGGLFACAVCVLFAKAVAPAAKHYLGIGAEAEKALRGRKTFGRREDGSYPVTLASVAIVLALAVLLGAANADANHRETGHWIVMEDYGSLDIYLANNEKAGPDWYHSGKVPQFANARYNEIVSDASLDRYQQNELAGEALREYAEANWKTVLKNAAVRYKALFFDTWGNAWWAALCGLLLLLLSRRPSRGQKVGILLAFCFLTIPPAFGLLVARYSAPALALLIPCVFAAAGILAAWICARFSGRAARN